MAHRRKPYVRSKLHLGISYNAIGCEFNVNESTIWYTQKRKRKFTYACGYSVFPPPFVEETMLSPWSIFGSLVTYQLAIYVCMYFWALDPFPRAHVSVFANTILSCLLQPAV